MKKRPIKFGNMVKFVIRGLMLVVLMAVNVQVGLNDGTKTDIRLLGLEVSVFASTAEAYMEDAEEGEGGYCAYYNWECDNPYGNCGSDGGPGIEPCMIYCVGGAWVYCDGCGGGCPD